MNITTLCEVLLIMSIKRPQLYLRNKHISKIGEGLPDQSMDLVKELGATHEEIKTAFRLLVNAEYFRWKDAGQNEWIEITEIGEFLRDNGGYRHHVEKDEDRNLQRLVSQSVIDTNESVRITNDSVMSNSRWQAIGAIGAVIIAIVALLVSIFKDTQETRKSLGLQPEQPQTSTQRLLSSTFYLVVLPQPSNSNSGNQ